MLSQVLSQEEELHWLALKLVPGLGARFSKRLLDRFRTPQAIFHASRTELEKAGISGAVAQSIASGFSFEDAAAQQEKTKECGAVLVTIGDPRYPAPLRDTPANARYVAAGDRGGGGPTRSLCGISQGRGRD